MLTLGSLFNGIGGWIIAGNKYGVKTLWESEVEKYCEALMLVRFPDVQQLGDVTKIDGTKLKSVDIVCAGSPCQNLSVAGNREGLAGEQSGLFRDAIRIIRQLRMSSGRGDSSSGRTYQVHLQADRSVVLTLEPCLKASQKPIFQCLKMEDGQKPEWFNAQSVKLHGEHLTLNFGEYPNEEKESFLSQILQKPTDVPQKYYLSSRACQGILNRAEKRGKELPAPLKKALEQQANLSTGGGTFDIRISSNGTKNWRAHCYETDKCRSLDTHSPDPDTNHGGVAILEEKVSTVGGQIYDMTHANDVIRQSSDVTPTLNARMGTGGNQVPILMENIPNVAMSTTGGQSYSIGNGQLDQLKMSEKVGALNCMHDQIAVMQPLVTEETQSEVCAPMMGEDSTDRMLSKES